MTTFPFNLVAIYVNFLKFLILDNGLAIKTVPSFYISTRVPEKNLNEGAKETPFKF